MVLVAFHLGNLGFVEFLDGRADLVERTAGRLMAVLHEDGNSVTEIILSATSVHEGDVLQFLHSGVELKIVLQFPVAYDQVEERPLFRTPGFPAHPFDNPFDTLLWTQVANVQKLPSGCCGWTA